MQNWHYNYFNYTTILKDITNDILYCNVTFKSHLSQVLAIVMDTFTDVEIFCDVLEATRKRSVSVYLLLDHTNLQVFEEMCENLKISKSHLTVSYSI